MVVLSERARNVGAVQAVSVGPHHDSRNVCRHLRTGERFAWRKDGGEGGIRTPGTVARTPHFECGAIDHSATSPRGVRQGVVPERALLAQRPRGGQLVSCPLALPAVLMDTIEWVAVSVTRTWPSAVNAAALPGRRTKAG